MTSNSSFKKHTHTKVLMACTSCRRRKVRSTDFLSLTRSVALIESLLGPAKEAPGGDEVFLYDPYPTNSASTSLSPSPSTNHSDLRLSQPERSRHSYSADPESYSQSHSVVHANDSMRSIWGHSSTNKPSDTELDKEQISSGCDTEYPDFPRAKGSDIPYPSRNYVSSGTTSGRNGYPGSPTYPIENRMPVQSPSRSPVSQNYGHDTTSENVGETWSGGHTRQLFILIAGTVA
ncbi:hypothetical protein L218DRAFT_950608 [Marasmius fiardii PR-910]|nr:hypothetical protein L218DRAFT_950608 [Marasmius fiardii PR-910]